MPLIEKHYHVHHHILLQRDDPVVNLILAQLAAVTNRQDLIMIDTSKLLAAVAVEQTESASLRALVAANTAALKDVSSQLATLQASGGATAAQLQQVQNDVDAATASLSSDNQAAVDAVAANTIPPPAPEPLAPTTTAPITTDAPAT